jgi:membrane protein DedA with SNARE-associated domain/membrane-associated phospholipid phosphatase
MLDVVSQWVAHYGYALVAVFLLVEGMGVPIPGETALVTAAAIAGRGTMSIVGVIIAGCIGTIAGGQAGYWIGLRGGTRVVAKYGRWFRLNDARLDRTHRFFAQHGGKTVLLGRFVAFLRSFVGIFAGVSEMPARTFATYNALGGAVWVATFSLLGYLFGRNLPRLVHYLGRVSLLLAILIAVVAGVVLLWRWFERNRTQVAASIDESWNRATESHRISAMGVRHPLVRRVMARRFARGEYLALHLAAGFFVSLALIAVFASITEGLVESSPLTRFDVILAARLQASAAVSALRLFAVISSLGGRGAMTVLLFAGAVVYAARRSWLELVGWCAAFIGGSLLDATLRFVVRRSELPFADVVLIDWGTGLASGHALGVVLGYGMLAYLIGTWIRRRWLRAIVVALSIVMIAGITVSRLFLGQHYFSDASAGVAAGIVWLATCTTGIELARARRAVGAREAPGSG